MNTLLKLFKNPDINLDNYRQSDLDEVTTLLIQYMFKLITLQSLKRQMRPYEIPTDEWRERANNSSDVAKVKLWIRYVCKYPHKNSARRFHLTNSEDVNIKNILLDDDRLRKSIKDIPGVVFTWDKMQTVMSNAMLDLSDFAKKRSYHKLRFLENDSGNGIEDFQSELLAHVVSGIYAKYPRFDDYPHLLNTGRTIVNNMSINIIKHHTSKGRACKYQNSDGSFGSHKVSLDALTENTASNELMFGDAFATNKAQDEMEVQHSLESLLISPKKVRAVSILMGYDKEFSKWLVDRNITVATDNTRYQERLISKGKNKTYLKYIAEYLEIPIKKFMLFLQALTVGLGGADKVIV